MRIFEFTKSSNNHELEIYTINVNLVILICMLFSIWAVLILLMIITNQLSLIGVI